MLDALKSEPSLTHQEMLAVAAQLVGQLLAVQNPARTREAYLNMVTKNIEAGNTYAVMALTADKTRH